MVIVLCEIQAPQASPIRATGRIKKTPPGSLSATISEDRMNSYTLLGIGSASEGARKIMAGTKRTTIEPHKSDKRYVRRNSNGEFTKDQVDVGKSLAADRRTKAKTIVPKGQGDRGDTKR